MGSMMIILFIAHFFRKDQTYASLFSQAFQEGINDTFKNVRKQDSKVQANESLDAATQ